MKIKRPRNEPRFVVRSVTGFAITPGALGRDGKEHTVWSIHDSALCYRVIAIGHRNAYGTHYNLYDERGRKLARSIARQLNAEDKAYRENAA